MGLWTLHARFIKGADGKWCVWGECLCGRGKWLRYTDVRVGGTTMCRSCAISVRMHNALAADPAAYPQCRPGAKQIHSPRAGAYDKLQRRMSKTATGMRQRCTNPAGAAYADYGGRGILFKFSSVHEAALYMAAALGEPPSPRHTVDRIDNDAHYEPGNLRWATRSEQARNKRPYKGSVYGHRMRALLLARPDYTYEGLRRYIKLGCSDAEIINMVKPRGGRPRKDRHDSSGI